MQFALCLGLPACSQRSSGLQPRPNMTSCPWPSRAPCRFRCCSLARRLRFRFHSFPVVLWCRVRLSPSLCEPRYSLSSSFFRATLLPPSRSDRFRSSTLSIPSSLLLFRCLCAVCSSVLLFLSPFRFPLVARHFSVPAGGPSRINMPHLLMPVELYTAGAANESTTLLINMHARKSMCQPDPRAINQYASHDSFPPAAQQPPSPPV